MVVGTEGSESWSAMNDILNVHHLLPLQLPFVRRRKKRVVRVRCERSLEEAPMAANDSLIRKKRKILSRGYNEPKLFEHTDAPTISTTTHTWRRSSFKDVRPRSAASPLCCDPVLIGSLSPFSQHTLFIYPSSPLYLISAIMILVQSVKWRWKLSNRLHLFFFLSSS